MAYRNFRLIDDDITGIFHDLIQRLHDDQTVICMEYDSDIQVSYAVDYLAIEYPIYRYIKHNIPVNDTVEEDDAENIVDNATENDHNKDVNNDETESSSDSDSSDFYKINQKTNM